MFQLGKMYLLRSCNSSQVLARCSFSIFSFSSVPLPVGSILAGSAAAGLAQEEAVPEVPGGQHPAPCVLGGQGLVDAGRGAKKTT